MTTLAQTPPAQTPVRTPLVPTPLGRDLSSALDGLAAAAEQARDDARTRAVLAVVVQRLEDAAEAGLGDTAGDPLVVLQRRFGRVHALLAGRPAALEPGLLHGLADAVEGPAARAAGAVRPATPCPVPATC